MEFNPNWFICNTTPASKAQGYRRTDSRKIVKSQRKRKLAVISCLLGLSEAISMKSHQQGCLNMTRTKLTCTGMLTNMKGDKLWRPQPQTKKLQTMKVYWDGRNNLPKGRTHQLAGYPTPNRPENIHTRNIIWIEQTVFIYSGIYTYSYIHTYICNN